jgi:hypothetical protein
MSYFKEFFFDELSVTGHSVLIILGICIVPDNESCIHLFVSKCMFFIIAFEELTVTGHSFMVIYFLFSIRSINFVSECFNNNLYKYRYVLLFQSNFLTGHPNRSLYCIK